MRNVRLSQCMIVKNEERNIEKALSWGKNIVCEQIVADTGSTDRTIEIAERMGAKVVHYEWVNDFGAAKNFALEQAGGDWIAFLDADEYFPEEYAKKLLPILSQIAADPKMRTKCLAISCPMDQLDDDGRSIEVNVQVRLFRNLPNVRYKGRIHEQLSIGAPDIIRTEDIRIHHTGYSESANIGKGKSERNISLLRAELKENPDDPIMKMYLAESLVALSNEIIAEQNTAGTDSTDSERIKALTGEAEALHKEVANSDMSSHDPEFVKTSYRYLLRRYSKETGEDPGYDEICDKAIREFPDDNKIVCLYAAVLNSKGKYKKAYDLLKKLEKKQSDASTRSFAYSVNDMIHMCKELVTAAQGLGDADGVFQYTAAILAADKTNIGMLSIYIKMLIMQLPSFENVLEILGMMYDLGNPADCAIIKEAAGACGAAALAEKL